VPPDLPSELARSLIGKLEQIEPGKKTDGTPAPEERDPAL